MKHRRRSASWAFTRRRHQIKEVSAGRVPVQLTMFGADDDGVAEETESAPVSKEPAPATLAGLPPVVPNDAALEPMLLISDDGVIEFRLAGSSVGVTLTRVHRRTPHERVDVSIAFGSEASFLQWCEADPLRYTYPLLLMRLKRSGCALFDRTK